tara:strand:- start:187 stop:1098 length:912 start_codon:yes stop_codon:yes gene_type:complete
MCAHSQGVWLQDKHCRADASRFDETNSRAIVALGTVFGRESCVEVDIHHSITLLYRDEKCRAGRAEYEEFQDHTPTKWEPKCVVVLIEAGSRQQLRDELVESGRVLVHPIRLAFNYTTALSPNPDLEVSASNCALGRTFLHIHEHDTAGQAERDALHKAIQDLADARTQFALFEEIYLGLSAYMPPSSPPPPNPPPAPYDAPPAAPVALPLHVRYGQLRKRVEDLVVEVAERDAAIQLCVPSATNTCGRSSVLAPNPWMANDEEKCYGHGTWEALEYAYCAYWGSPVRHPLNPNTPSPVEPVL